MRIGELSALTGVNERLLRYYEQQGLLRPERQASGYRDYESADVTSVRNIRTLLAAGLNTAVIADVLPCMVDDGAEDGRRRLAAGCPELLDVLKTERERIDGRIDELEATRAVLDAIIATPVPVDASC